MGLNQFFHRINAFWRSRTTPQSTAYTSQRTQQGTRRCPNPAAQARPFVACEQLEGRLQFDTSGLPADALLPDLVPLVNKQLGYVYRWSLDRQEKPGRTLLRLTTAMANYGPGPMEIRGGDHALEGQEVFQRIYNADKSYTDRLAGNFTYHPHHNHTHFDDFAQYNLREMNRKGGAGKIIRSGRKVSFCLTDSDEVGGAITGKAKKPHYDACSTSVQGISVGWADVYGQSLVDQWVDITKVKPGRYWLEVVVDPSNRLIETNEKNNTRRIQVVIKPFVKPHNDDFSGRATINTGANIRANNSAASTQPAEPDHAGVPGGTSLWWSWTAPSSGRAILSTRGSTFDTLLGVYTGSSLGKLRRVASNDDDGLGDRTSSVNFSVRKGITYQIAIDGYRGATGNVRLSLSMK